MHVISTWCNLMHNDMHIAVCSCWDHKQDAVAGVKRFTNQTSKKFYSRFWLCLFEMDVENACMVGMELEMSAQIAKFMGPTWGPPGSCRPQTGPMLAPWTLHLGWLFVYFLTYRILWTTKHELSTSSRTRPVYPLLPILTATMSISQFENLCQKVYLFYEVFVHT